MKETSMQKIMISLIIKRILIFFTVKGQGKRGYTCKKKTNSGWRVVGKYILNWDLIELKDRFHS